MSYAKIIGMGCYAPEKVYDNAYMESIVDTSDEWIVQRTGVKRRHICADDQFTTDIATEAAKKALASANMPADELELIILATVTPDYFTPSCACVVQKNIEADNAAAFDINAACSGFVTAMNIAKQFIENGTYKNALIIGADEEGGTVVRVSSNPNLAPEKFKSPQEIYNEGGMDAVVENATEKSELLLSLGVNMNLAPVADVSTNPSDYMYDRSLGQNAEVTADFVSKTVTAMNNVGIMSVLKHFPGYGGVGGDSHQGTVYDDKTAESIRENDLLPFKAGIEAGASSVLVAHNTINALDSENPASLSPTIHNMLRDECGFDGVIMTDDIAMGAVADMENVYVKAVNAGNDLLITTDYQTGYNQILNAVKCGEISEETLNSAVERVLKMKGQI